MFFLGLTVSLILLLSGIVLLVEASYIVGSILLGSGIIFLIVWMGYYRNRNRKKDKEGLDCFDCNGAAVDCSNFPLLKKRDCDCDGDKGFDCDCSPN